MFRVKRTLLPLSSRLDPYPLPKHDCTPQVKVSAALSLAGNSLLPLERESGHRHQAAMGFWCWACQRLKENDEAIGHPCLIVLERDAWDDTAQRRDEPYRYPSLYLQEFHERLLTIKKGSIPGKLERFPWWDIPVWVYRFAYTASPIQTSIAVHWLGQHVSA
ncbi:hypothetical protein NKDENANG_02658 [Candidatus Entotheonellaceae bacterium PAL068K]